MRGSFPARFHGSCLQREVATGEGRGRFGARSESSWRERELGWSWQVKGPARGTPPSGKGKDGEGGLRAAAGGGRPAAPLAASCRVHVRACINVLRKRLDVHIKALLRTGRGDTEWARLDRCWANAGLAARWRQQRRLFREHEGGGVPCLLVAAASHLDLVEHLAVSGGCHKGDGQALGAETAGTADAVQVGVGAVAVLLVCGAGRRRGG